MIDNVHRLDSKVRDKVEDLQVRIDRAMRERQFDKLSWYNLLTAEQRQTMDRALARGDYRTPATVESVLVVLATIATGYEFIMTEQADKLLIREVGREGLDIWTPKK